jgi:tartrate-resistant acid phosphatase type 5
MMERQMIHKRSERMLVVTLLLASLVAVALVPTGMPVTISSASRVPGQQASYQDPAMSTGGIPGTDEIIGKADPGGAVISSQPYTGTHGAYLPVVARYEIIRFAVIGDYGSHSQAEQDVANLVTSWHPDLILTTGDNNYDNGEAKTIDLNIGQFYSAFIYPYNGRYASSNPSSLNRFFPTLGNHDWSTPGAQPYLDYFELPGKERYYDFVWGPAHFFAIDSDVREPDGNSRDSIQASWLRDRLSASTAPWKIVYMHGPPFSSGYHGSQPTLQWPYKEWGATAVLAGHDHTYERILKDGLPYFVNGLGGQSIYSFRETVAGSQVRYRGDYGAMLVDATCCDITFRFYTRSGQLVDVFTLDHAGK